MASAYEPPYIEDSKKIVTMGFRVDDKVSVKRSNGEIDDGWRILDFEIRDNETWAVVGRPGSNTNPKALGMNYARGKANEGDLVKRLTVRELRQTNDLVQGEQELKRIEAGMRERARQEKEEAERAARGPERRQISQVEADLVGFIVAEFTTARSVKHVRESLRRIVEKLASANGLLSSEATSRRRSERVQEFSVVTEKGELGFELRKTPLPDGATYYNIMPFGKNAIEGLGILQEIE